MSEVVFPDIDLMNIEGVLIDIDNTLYSYEPLHLKALRYCYEKLVMETFVGLHDLSFESFKKAYRSERTKVFERLSPHGACRSRLFAFQAFFEEMDVDSAYVKAHKFENFYWDFLIENMTVSSEALVFLKSCKEKKIKVCAVSDMQAHFQIRKLTALGLTNYIDFLTTSEEVGFEKPAEIIFEIALEKLRLPSNKAVIMIGDSEEKDIQGAEKKGIKAYKVTIK